MEVKIVDTTMRDGEQKAGIALGIVEKVEIAKLLDSAGIYQIEAGIPAMEGTEKKSIGKIVELNLKSKISTWNRMNIEDIKHSMDCGVQIIHITAPASDIQIKAKLNKDRKWIEENMKRCIYFIKERGFEVTMGLEDASRADNNFLLHLIKAAKELGVERVRYADTVGILHARRSFEEISAIKQKVNIGIEVHAHNDFGMAVANSIYALKAGAEYVDCTIGGIGERAGNCNFIEFIKATRGVIEVNKTLDDSKLIEIQDEINGIIHYKVRDRLIV